MNMRPRNAIGLALVVSALLGVTPRAQAQAVSEVEQLRAQLRTLEERLRQLEARQLQAPPAAAAAAPAEQAAPRSVEPGTERVNLALSGQVNRGVLYADDGTASEVFHVDNDNSSTRIRLDGNATLSEEVSVGAVIEVQFESNSSSAVSLQQDSPVGPNNFTERKLEIFADSKRLGRLWLGQGDTASNGSAEMDLSGTSVVAYSSISDMAGGIEFRTAAGAFGPSIGTVFTNFDGLSRDDRIRYDTPKFGGVQASFSHVDGGSWDASLRYTGKFDEIAVAAAIAYADAASRQGYSQLSGSASVKLPIGVSVTGAMGGRDDVAGRDPFFYYGKLAYTMAPLPWGETSVGVDYTMAEDVAAAGDEFTSYAVFLVQSVDQVATDLFVAARNHQLDRPGTSFDDVFAALGGARVKF